MSGRGRTGGTVAAVSSAVSKFAIRGGVSIDGDSLSSTAVTETPGASGLDGVSYGGGTTFDFHWFQWLNLFMGGAFHVVKNNAVAGSTMPAIAARWAAGGSTSPFNDDTDILFLGPIGINSLNATLALYTIPQMLADYESLISQASAGKKVVVASSLWPVSAGWSGYDRASLIPTISFQMEAICAKYPNVIYIDSKSILQDVTNDNGDALPGYTRTDFIHPTKRTGKALGRFKASKLAPRLTITEYLASAVDIGPGFSGSSGTLNAFAGAGLTTAVTGIAPFTGWDVSVTSGPGSATGVSVVVSNSATLGRLVLTITNTSGTDIVVEMRQIASVHASYTPGTDKMFVKCGLGAIGMVNTKAIDLQIQRAGSSTTPIGTLLRSNYAEDQKAFNGVARSALYAPAAGLTSLKLAVVAEVGATNGSCVLEIVNPYVGKA